MYESKPECVRYIEKEIPSSLISAHKVFRILYLFALKMQARRDNRARIINLYFTSSIASSAQLFTVEINPDFQILHSSHKAKLRNGVSKFLKYKASKNLEKISTVQCSKAEFTSIIMV